MKLAEPATSLAKSRALVLIAASILGFVSERCSRASWLLGELIPGGRGVCGHPNGQEPVSPPAQLGRMEVGVCWAKLMGF